MRTYFRNPAVLLPLLLPVALVALTAGCYTFDDVPTIESHPEAGADGIPDVPAPSTDSPVDEGELDGGLPDDGGLVVDVEDAPSVDAGDASEDTGVD
jgi:hypothetical protein